MYALLVQVDVKPEHRDAFVTKCVQYLQQGVGLVLIDVVTERHPAANLP